MGHNALHWQETCWDAFLPCWAPASPAGWAAACVLRRQVSSDFLPLPDLPPPCRCEAGTPGLQSARGAQRASGEKPGKEEVKARFFPTGLIPAAL